MPRKKTRQWGYGLNADLFMDASRRFEDDQSAAKYLGCSEPNLRSWRNGGEPPGSRTQRTLRTMIDALSREDCPFLREAPKPRKTPRAKSKRGSATSKRRTKKKAGSLVGHSMKPASSRNHAQDRSNVGGKGRPANVWTHLTAQELRDFRLAKGSTQGDIAKLLGCAISSMSRWETDTQAPPEAMQLKMRELIDGQ